MVPRSIRIALIACALFAFLGAGFWIHALFFTRSPVVAAPPVQAQNAAEALQSAFVSVAERVRPAVVHISPVQVAKRRRPPVTPGPFSDDPSLKDFFDQFFGPRGPGPRDEFQQRALGSGVIIDKRGYVLTNNHVVIGADGVVLRLASKREYRGKIIGTDVTTDLAVIQFEPETDVPVATLGNSDTLRVVSATGRADVGIATYENFIQTDASINPGNSGGPLVNLRGEVIGINTAIVAAAQGIGFAIPANMVKRVTSQLMDRGKVTRGWIGIAMEPLTAELAQSLGLREPRGAVVARVYPGGPAATAGLEKNDVVVTFEGVPVDDYGQLRRLSADAEVGKTVKLEIVRNRERKTIELRVAEAPDRMPPDRPGPSHEQLR